MNNETVLCAHLPKLDPVVDVARHLSSTAIKADHMVGGASPEILTLLRSLEYKMAENRATSAEGALVQAMIAFDIALSFEGTYRPEEQEKYRYYVRMLKRLIASTVHVLTDVSGVNRSDLGGSYYFPDCADPFK